MVAINKPSGLLTLPDRHNAELSSLSGLLKKKYNEIFIVHRLDKDTSGLIIFAKHAASHKYLSKLFESREVSKFYLGIVNGILPNEKGSIKESLMEHPVQAGKMVVNSKGKTSHTDYQVKETFDLYSLVEMQIHTGRMHQIRVHMKWLGHPVAVDALYGNGKPIFLSNIKKKFKLGKYVEEERPLLGRLALHSYRLEFNGYDGQIYSLEAPLPKDMNAVLQQLRKQVR